MSVLFIDSETEPTSHAVHTPPAVCAQIAVDDGPVEIVSPDVGRRMLEEHRGPVVGHALAFEALVLGHRPREAYDTQIRAVIQGAAAGKNEKASSSLADLARPLGVALTGKGSVQLSFRVGARLTPEQVEYAKQDVVATRAVWHAQGGARRLPDEERQLRASYDVMAMARRGVRLDTERVSSLLADARANVARLQAPLRDAGILQWSKAKKDWGVKREVVQGLLAAAGATQRPKRRVQDARPPSELLAASGDVLRGTGNPALVALADYKDAEKWVSLVEAFDVGPVARAFWKPMVASGRIAASRPNLTQVPKGALRECVIPSDGNVLVTADFNALEFRVWADVCMRWLGWSDAADAFQAGRDPHDILLAALGPGFERRDAKNGNYMFIGGAGAPRAAATWGCELKKAEAIRAAWWRTWSESRSYFRRIKAGAEGEGRYRVTVPWSDRERLGYYSEAANFVIQATGADVAKEALMRATRAGLPVTMLVHDELVLDVPRGDAEEASRLLCAAMEEAGREVCPNVPWSQKAEIRERWA